ncbi:EAL domain-containing protein [Deinococcus sp. YIM 134068]|uniref:putative bifunctional diguanylate cyclase/phosphodiesterase n=1 Tax=Deinococcus lichenicola TaxID=3118910 RepID=UPI002F9299C3
MTAQRRRHVWITLLYLLGWLALDAAAQQFNTVPGVSVWYPPFALDFVLLLVFGLRYWPLLIVSNVLHELLITPQPLPPLPLLASVVVAVAGSTLACVVLRHLRFDARLPRLRDVRLFVLVAVFGAPLIVTTAQVLCLVWADLVPWGRVIERTLQLWAGTATGIGMLAPSLLLLLRRWPGLWTAGLPVTDEPVGSGGPGATAPISLAPRLAGRQRLLTLGRRVLEGLAELSVAGLALWIGYGGPRGGTLDFSYVLFVPLLWTATRHGFERTALAVLGLNVGVALLTGGPDIRRTDGLALQFGLLTVTVSGLLLGAVMRERRRLTERLSELALRDPLTGLGNRRLFHERVAQALTRRPPPAGTLAVLLMDFDDFKTINDTLGHSAGDEVLRAVGRRLEVSVPPPGVVARLGGDEFAVLLEDMRGPGEAVRIARQLLRVLDEPVPVGDQSLRVGASVGVTVWDGTGEDGETLLRDADVALYRAKAGRRGQVQLFDASMHIAVLERVELEAELRASLVRGDFELHYQPLVDAPTGLPTGVEALVRWRHPTRGLLTPDAFMPLAEETGLVVPLGHWVLRAACREVVDWTGAPGSPPPTVGVNLSAAHLAQPRLVEEVAATLRETGLAPERLMLEITESVLIRDLDTTLGTLRALRGLGVRLAVDDFGTGYSSLSYLRHLPIQDLKVDRAFVTDLERDAAATELARVIAVLGRTLGLNTVAEGVETAQQYARIRALGYTLAQGYYIARPLPADQARALVEQGRPLVSQTV